MDQVLLTLNINERSDKTQILKILQSLILNGNRSLLIVNISAVNQSINDINSTGAGVNDAQCY